VSLADAAILLLRSPGAAPPRLPATTTLSGDAPSFTPCIPLGSTVSRLPLTLGRPNTTPACGFVPHGPSSSHLGGFLKARILAWADQLRFYPDSTFVCMLLNIFDNGASLGTDGASKRVHIPPYRLNRRGINFVREETHRRLLADEVRVVPSNYPSFITPLGVRQFIHYLDDFCGCTSSAGEAAASLRVFRETCSTLGLPVNEKKCLGPSTYLEILGIEVDTRSMQARLGADRVRRMIEALSLTSRTGSATRLKLQRLAGLLVFACRVLPHGRVFLQRIWSAMRTASHRRRRVPSPTLADMRWWLSLLPTWPGILYLRPPTTAAVHIWTDASGTKGAGGHLGEAGQATDAFSYAFPKRHREKHITFKELHAVVHAVELFGRGARWEDREIVIHTDNTAVTAAVQTGYLKHVAPQSLLRRL